RFEDSHARVPHGRRGYECVPRFAHEAAPGGCVVSVAARPFRDGVGDRGGVGVRQPVWRVGNDCVYGFGWPGFHCFDAVAMGNGWPSSLLLSIEKARRFNYSDGPPGGLLV